MLETLKRKLGGALSKLLMEQAQRNPYQKALMLKTTLKRREYLNSKK